jgi:flagellar hook assembly protein FlgD
LALYNLRGQSVRTLVQENQKSGDHSVRWNGENETGGRVPSGVYVYHLKVKTADRTSTLSRKIMLLE